MSSRSSPVERVPVGTNSDAAAEAAHAEALLAERTAMLAARRHEADESKPVVRVLTVARGSERWALPVDELGPIFTLTSVGWVPGADPALLGVASNRGELVGVYDLGAIIGGRDPDPGKSLQAVNIRHASRRMALGVERVEGMEDIDIQSLSPPDAGSAGPSPLIVGVNARGTILLSVTAIVERITKPGERLS